MQHRFLPLISAIALWLFVGVQVFAQPDTKVPKSAFLLDLVLGDRTKQEVALVRLKTEWHPGLLIPALEAVHVSANQALAKRVMDLLRKKTGNKEAGYSLNAWYAYAWNQDYQAAPDYPEYKAQLYRLLDRKFEGYFSSDRTATIRLDEVRWGGVGQDGIPPLRDPQLLSVSDAGYLSDTDVVFGLAVNGEFRAYPKRILAWHELLTETVAGVPLAVVYCTLCGTVIAFQSEFAGTAHQLGTSGFLYRSNKLMYDQATQSLWNTIWGEPVIGPLVGKGIRLEDYPVVTTTWGEWKTRHPDTKVLSLETGHSRDYGEGVAYHEYFATDDLMFNTPFAQAELPNKTEVVVLELPGQEDGPLAITADYLWTNNQFAFEEAGKVIMVLTDQSGAARMYEVGEREFLQWNGRDHVIDKIGSSWEVREAGIYSEDGTVLPRITTHRAFWFGWKAAHPNTRLVR